MIANWVRDYMPANKEDAIDHGNKRYNSTVPCSKGHVGQRYAISDKCVQCSKAKQHTRIKRKELAPSKMVEIDHILERRAELAFVDPYYYLDI